MPVAPSRPINMKSDKSLWSVSPFTSNEWHYFALGSRGLRKHAKEKYNFFFLECDNVIERLQMKALDW